MFGLCNKPIMLILALLIGAAVSTAIILAFKKEPSAEEEEVERISVTE